MTLSLWNPKEKGSEVNMKITEGLGLLATDGCEKGKYFSALPLGSPQLVCFLNGSLMVPWNHDILRQVHQAV